MSSEKIPFSHPAWIEIDLNAFIKNIQNIHSLVKPAKVCLPIKANAYGHGLLEIARAAVQAGVDYLAVAYLQEAIVLREGGIRAPIFVMGAVYEEQIQSLIEYDIEFSIASLFKAKLAANIATRLKKKCKIHLEIDTGMQRTGVRPDTAFTVIEYIQSQSFFELVGVYSHLARGDEPAHIFSHQQIEVFTLLLRKIKRSLPHLIGHIANSGGICFYPDSYLDMVRPGLLAFGFLPHPQASSIITVEPIFSVKAKVSYFKVVAPQQGISYHHTYITQKQERIVTIPVGYGDGYRRALSNKGQVLIRGQRYPIVGNICMDQCMVNISQAEAYVGEEVVLIGKQGQECISLLEVAQWCDTIPYEILCGFNNRLPRMYFLHRY